MGALMQAAPNPRQPCTILMPIYNASDFLDKSISNICEISGSTDEILIIDDGSTDLSNQKIKEIKKLDARIKFVRRSHEGLVAALNYGIEHSSNEFIARVDVDDCYHRSRLDIQTKYLENNPSVVALFSDYKMTSTSGSDLGLFACGISPELTAFSLLSSQRTPHPVVMFRKSVAMKVAVI